MKKSLLVITLLVFLIATFFTLKPSQQPVSQKILEEKSKNSAEYLDFIAENMVGGGPEKDGIPAIDKPIYVSAEEADSFLSDDSVVFGIDYKDRVVAFPQSIMYWHEVVNDKVNGEKISITYCPLTGSTIGYKGRNLGVSGKLYNSNLVLYDRETDSEIPQVLGIAVNGPLKGEKLDSIHVFQTTWKDWKRKYPNTKVLSPDTGYSRDYSRNPYPGYDDILRVWFPLAAESDLFRSKEWMVGIETDNGYYAIPKKLASKPFSISNASFSYDPTLKTTISDKDIKYFDVHWFAWYAYHPDTKVIDSE